MSEDPIDLVEECITKLHKDKALASLLVPKLYKGCIEFEEELRWAKEKDDGNETDRTDSSRGSVKKENLKKKQRSMLKKLKMLRDRHKDA